MDTIQHSRFLGRVKYDDEAGTFHGEVHNTRDVITFQSTTVNELRQAFRESVEDYLAFCMERGEEPDNPLFGQFMTRVDPELHRQISQSAGLAGMSLNAWVNEKLTQAVGQVTKKRGKGVAAGG